MFTRRLLVPLGVAAFIAAAPGLAAAAWNTNGAGNAAAKATTLTTPSATGSTNLANAVTVTWTTPTPGTAQAASTYFVTGDGTCSAVASTGTCQVTGLSNAAATRNFQIQARFGAISATGNWHSGSSSFTGATVAALAPMHIKSITATAGQQNNNSWHATVTITIVDGSNNNLSGVTVNGGWSPASSEPGNCAAVTNAAGACTRDTGNNAFTTGATVQTWTPSAITKTGFTWDSAADLKSSIQISCPASGSCTVN